MLLIKDTVPQKGTSERSGALDITIRNAQTLLQKPAFIISLLGIFGIVILYSMRTSFYSVYFDEVGLSAPDRCAAYGSGAAEMAIRPFTITWRNRYGTAPLFLL